jgi:hypothetical protein
MRDARQRRIAQRLGLVGPSSLPTPSEEAPSGPPTGDAEGGPRGSSARPPRKSTAGAMNDAIRATARGARDHQIARNIEWEEE